MQKTESKFKNISERIGLTIAISNIVWLLRNVDLLNGNLNMYFFDSMIKAKWTLIAGILLSLTGIIIAMELRKGKIKLITGIFICGLLLAIGTFIEYNWN